MNYLMKTIVLLHSNIPNTPHTKLFEIDGAMPLNVGDTFRYKASEPNKTAIETAQSKIKYIEENNQPHPSWGKYKIQDIQRKMDISRDHFEKWGEGVKFVVESKDVSVYRGSDFLNDNVINTTIYLYVDVYDESYIRNKKIEEVL